MKPSDAITCLSPGELVTLHLRGWLRDSIWLWAGEVVVVDRVAIRLKVCWYRCGLDFTAHQAEGNQVIPWSRIDRVQIEERKG